MDNFDLQWVAVIPEGGIIIRGRVYYQAKKNHHMKIVKIIFVLVAVILVGRLFIIWSKNHDEQIEKSANRYEECVRSEYGVSPAQWREENGSYPECK